MKKESQQSRQQAPNADCGVVKGIVLYLNGDPASARALLLRLGSAILDLMQRASDDSSVAGFTKRTKTRWKQFVESASFESSERFAALRSTAKEYKEGQLLMMGASPSPGCLNLPSFIYAELPRSTDDQEIVTILVDAIKSGEVFLAMSDLILAENPKNYPKSAAAAVKYLVREGLPFKRADDTWLNPSFRTSLAKDLVNVFDGPNRIIGVSSDLARENLKHLDWESLLSTWRQDIQSGVFLQARTADDYRRLAAAISTSVFPIKKPQMFWKQEDWDQWLDRFLAS